MKKFYHIKQAVTIRTKPLESGYRFTTVTNQDNDKKLRVLHTEEYTNSQNQTIKIFKYNLSRCTQKIGKIVVLGDTYHIPVTNKYGDFFITGKIDELQIFKHENGVYVQSLNTLMDFGIAVDDGVLMYMYEYKYDEYVPVKVGDKLSKPNGHTYKVLCVCPDGALVLYGWREKLCREYSYLMRVCDKDLCKSFCDLTIGEYNE